MRIYIIIKLLLVMTVTAIVVADTVVAGLFFGSAALLIINSALLSIIYFLALKLNTIKTFWFGFSIGLFYIAFVFYEFGSDTAGSFRYARATSRLKDIQESLAEPLHGNECLRLLNEASEIVSITDPYSTSGNNLKVKFYRGQCLIYSVGPDRNDDHGVEEYSKWGLLFDNKEHLPDYMIFSNLFGFAIDDGMNGDILIKYPPD